ncbi:hypothetical protein [Actinomyces wuliandei]|uniref:hypothetical protein n=2 Tax=Actinomyces wuliandei TaxID=2057743 RepID=UPI000FD92281|nr:hypothetical protein [Actinomyces wuliandei]
MTPHPSPRPRTGGTSRWWLPTMVAHDHADEARTRVLWALPTTLIALPFGWVVLLGGALPLAVLLAISGISTVFFAAGAVLRLLQVRRAHRRWRHDSGAVVLVPTTGPPVWDILYLLGMLGGCLVSVVLIVLAGTASPYPATRYTLSLALPFAGLCLVGLVTFPYFRPGRPAVCLTPEGVWLWPRTRRQAWVPWQDQPELAGVTRGDAVITTTAGTTRFAMGYLSLGYNQLHRVLLLYTTHPELRHELAHPQGLDRVRTLMHTPVHQVEETLTT